ncbi:MAG: ATP-binding protein [Prevotella sp.]|nr:ATP-binding protein [Prevotella sp.]MBR6187476.1 ATP-binding protein [Prevotella sp.]
MIERFLQVTDAQEESVFLFGARQTGKTTLLLQLFPNSRFYDLLETDVYERLRRNPSLLRQELATATEGEIVIIDEIQLVPELLNEVHWLIIRQGLHFILSGSSARKLKRKGVNTLGGRAVRNVLYPLVSAEIPDFDLIKAVNRGTLPTHYLATSERQLMKRLQAYVSVYLKEEIAAEALVRKLSSFNRFMEVAALTDGEMVNYNNIAQDCGIDAKTVKEYFSILEETLIGYMVPAFTRTVKRRLNQAPRFYYFDVSLPNYLLRRHQMQPGGDDFGHAFEHLMIQEIVAYLGYHDLDNALSFWHTYSGYEVDAVLGDGKVAIEFKSCSEVQSKHLRGLKAFKEEHPDARLIVVSLDASPRLFHDVEVMPANYFLQKLWEGDVYA